MAGSDIALVPRGTGRLFSVNRLVRLGDVLPSGEARLSALAAYLQDVAADDGRDAGIDNHLAWLVRKTILGIERRPRLEEAIELTTWASGSGARWAERRTTISVLGVPVVEAASLWVCVDVATMRAVRLPDRFWPKYREAVGDRTVTPRLTHPEPSAALSPLVTATAQRPWPLRVSDLDMLGHVNNAATWCAVDDELDRVAQGRVVVTAEMEYREPIDGSFATDLVSRLGAGELRVWLSRQGGVLASASVGFA